MFAPFGSVSVAFGLKPAGNVPPITVIVPGTLSLRFNVHFGVCAKNVPPLITSSPPLT